MKIENGKAIPETDEEKAALRALVDEETTGLKSKNGELLGKLKGLEALKDIDPEEYKRLKKQAEDAEAERLKIAGNWEAREKQLLDAHQKEMDKLRAENTTLKTSLEENVLKATAIQAIAAEKGSDVLLMPHVRSRTKLDESGNPVVVDDQGNVRIDAQGKPLTIPALVAEMKADVATFGRAFDGTGAGGGGTPNNLGTGNGAGKFDHLPPAARIAAAREAGYKE